MVKKVEFWECSDGIKFRIKKDAVRHEKILKAEKWLRGGLSGITDTYGLIDFLQCNEENILDIMGWSKK